jgi:hypothetical protein
MALKTSKARLKCFNKTFTDMFLEERLEFKTAIFLILTLSIKVTLLSRLN